VERTITLGWPAEGMRAWEYTVLFIEGDSGEETEALLEDDGDGVQEQISGRCENFIQRKTTARTQQKTKVAISLLVVTILLRRRSTRITVEEAN